jgi:hypothetical protein
MSVCWEGGGDVLLKILFAFVVISSSCSQPLSNQRALFSYINDYALCQIIVIRVFVTSKCNDSIISVLAIPLSWYFVHESNS